MIDTSRALLGSAFATCLALASATTPALAQTSATPAPPVTVQGCLVQLTDSPGAPPTGHERAAATGLAVTRASSKVREGGGAPRTEQSFWLVGAKAAELLRFVGRKVELTGTIDDRLIPNPGTATRADALVLPSPPTRAISVNTFRALDEACS